MRTRGRPTRYTEKVAVEILQRMANGETLRKICMDKHLPSASTARLWVLEDREGFSERYAQARALLCEYWADEQIEIADNAKGDVQRDRLRVDTRKWLLSKLRPEEYGDRAKLEHSSEAGGVMLVPSGLTPEEWAKTARETQARLGKYVAGTSGG